MTREEPIRCETCRYDGMCIRQTHTMAIVDNCDRYEEYKERPHGEWIPCTERLPDERGYYLVTTDGSHNHVIDIAEYGFDWRGNDFVMGWNKASRILAWMPLPEPYKKESI